MFFFFTLPLFFLYLLYKLILNCLNRVKLSIYLSIHSAAPSFRVLRAVALSVQELKERL